MKMVELILSETHNRVAVEGHAQVALLLKKD